MGKKYKSVFFDADDTLFDYPSAERAALRACLDEFQIPVEPEAFLSAYRRHNRDVWQAFERGETSQAALRVERFRRLAAELAVPDLPLERVSAFYLDSLPGSRSCSPGPSTWSRAWPEDSPGPDHQRIAAVQNRRFAASPIISISGPSSFPRKRASPSPTRTSSRRPWRRSASRPGRSSTWATASPRTWPPPATPAWTSAGATLGACPARGLRARFVIASIAEFPAL